MPGEMFGAPTGLSAGLADEQSIVHNNFQALEAMGRLSMVPINAEHVQAQTKHLDIMGKAETLKYENELRWSQALQKMGKSGDGKPVGPEEIASKGWDLANLAIESGQPERGMKMAVEASNMQSHLASAATAQVRQARLAMSTQRDMMTMAGEKLGSVRSQEDLDKWMLETAAMSGDKAHQRIVYSPAVVKNLEQGFMTVKDRLASKEREVMDNARLGLISAQASHIRFRENQTKWMNDFRTAKEANRGKAEGKVLNVSRSMKDAATALLDDEQPGLSATESRYVMNLIASEASAAQQNNRALSPMAAVRDVYEKHKKDFQVTTSGGMNLPVLGNVGGKTSTKFIRPTALPKDPAKVKDGDWYTAPDGRTGQVRSGVFYPVDEDDDEED